jgi:Amt family ammonium transporter
MKKALISAIFALVLTASPALAQDAPPAFDSGDTAWMLVATLLVLMMSIPGLALFYGGLVKKDNVLATLMQTLAVCGLIGIAWPVIGYSLAFAEGNGFVGGMGKFMLAGVTPTSSVGTIPETVFIVFQLTFAVITAALLLGSVADRIKFSAVLIFAPLWMVVVYAPIAHWVWGPGGFLGGIGLEDTSGFLGFGNALDFAGGTVVHINSGIAGLVCALYLGRRIDYGKQTASTSNNLVMSVMGTGLLWVGWFGFNAGSALTAGASAGMAMLVTNSAAAMGCISWIVIELWHKKKASVVGALSGLVSGLVAITPAAGFVTFPASLVIGLATGVCCYFAVTWLKAWLRYDDSLDVFGIHGVGGIVGALLTGVFATSAVSSASGLIDGNPNQVIAQALSIVVTGIYSASATFILLRLVDVVKPIRVRPDVERAGLDLALHGEAAPWASVTPNGYATGEPRRAPAAKIE